MKTDTELERGRKERGPGKGQQKTCAYRQIARSQAGSAPPRGTFACENYSRRTLIQSATHVQVVVGIPIEPPAVGSGDANAVTLHRETKGANVCVHSSVRACA